MSEIFSVSRDPNQAIQNLLNIELPDEAQASKTRKLISGGALTRRDAGGKKIKGTGEYLKFRAHALCAEDNVEAMKTVRMLEKRAENWGFALQMMKLTPVTIISLLSVVHYIGGVQIPYVINGVGSAQWGILIGTLMGLNPLPLIAGVLHTMVTGGKWFGVQGFITRGGLAFAGSAALMFLLNSQAKRNLEEAWDRRKEIQDGMEIVYKHIHREYLNAQLSTIRDTGDDERLDELAETARHLIEKKKEIAQIYGANVDVYEEHIAAPCRRIKMFVEAIRHREGEEPIVDLDLIQEAHEDFNSRSNPDAGGQVTAPITLEQRARCIRNEIERLEDLRHTATERRHDATVAELSTKLGNYRRAAVDTQRLTDQRSTEWSAAGDDEAQKNKIREKYGYEIYMRDAYVVAYYASRQDPKFAEMLEEYRTGLRGFTCTSSEDNRPELIPWVLQKMGLHRGEKPNEELIRVYDVYLWHTREARPEAARPLGDLPAEASDSDREQVLSALSSSADGSLYDDSASSSSAT